MPGEREMNVPGKARGAGRARRATAAARSITYDSESARFTECSKKPRNCYKWSDSRRHALVGGDVFRGADQVGQQPIRSRDRVRKLPVDGVCQVSPRTLAVMGYKQTAPLRILPGIMGLGQGGVLR